MPASVDHSYAFIHIPKTGGLSILDALTARYGQPPIGMGSGLWPMLKSSSDPGLVMRRLRRSFTMNSITGFPLNHLPAVLLRELIGFEVWERLYSFAFVRNPWDLVVSSFNYMMQTYSNDPNTALVDRDYVEFATRNGGFPGYVQLFPVLQSPMSTMITDDDDRIIVKHVARFENLAAEVETISAGLGIALQVPHVNASQRGSYREYYDDETRDIVARHFSRDIERFGYEF
jgi:hypothetical protein